MKKSKFFSIALLILLGYGLFCVYLHVPRLKPTYLKLTAEAPSKIVWPTQGESAVGIKGTNILQIEGAQIPKPTASTAKLITALMILKAKPLSLNQPGPMITMNANDVAIYNNYLAKDGSVAKVALGEQISEYQMLEGMLLPSADNLADSLAIWAYGSLGAYAQAANHYLSSIGLNSTHVGADASGYDPSTVSTAQDLVKIGEIIMSNPVLSSIVSQPQATIPVAGVVYNVNNLLGKANIIGIKTGNTNQAGGVFVGAAKFNNPNNQPTTIISAYMGAYDLSSALNSSLVLLRSAQTNYTSTNLLTKGQSVASYKAPWSNQTVAAIANQTVSANLWGGYAFSLNRAHLQTINLSTPPQQTIGNFQDQALTTASSSVSLATKLARPPLWWSLTHP